MRSTDLAETFSLITNYWDPHIVAELNGQHVKCVKLKGEFVWHKHEAEDEMFLVHRGTLHGPQTLIQGWIALNDDRLEESIATLIRSFIPLADIIDELLEERKTASPSAKTRTANAA